jgi:hypothetical protein
MIANTYPAIRTYQVENGRGIVFFSAPATDIDSWAGIPQKKRDDETTAETTGFQRDENDKRIASIVTFLSDSRNVIQNPLLCAIQSTCSGKVTFIPDSGQDDPRTCTGKICIESDKLSQYSLLELMRRVKAQLESRVTELKGHEVDISLVNELKSKASIESALEEDIVPEEDDSEDAETDGEETDVTQEATELVFSDESHVLDFWRHLSARIQVIEEMGAAFSGTDFFGYTSEAMIAFLKPVVVMDGQHRLRGALHNARGLAGNPPYRQEIEAAIELGEPADIVQARAERRASRLLPVSLLITEDPAEHVFQFVVVNQKATPIGRALLGTIVSTTLSNDELNRVSERLTAADIKLEQSRAVAYLNRNPGSPFKDRVETGLVGDPSDRLAWSVMASLVRLFQKLKGGKLFGQKNDWADKWRRDYLDSSGIVERYAELNCKTAYDFWTSSDGPWREVFTAFFSEIRKEFGKDDAESWAYWGKPKTSNLFNKISLTILAADFFQFLVETRNTIASAGDLPRLVGDWLQPEVSRDYFNRDWKLTGAKKDSVGIRNNWSKLWVDYRKDPLRMPKSSEYRKNL